MCPGRLHAKFHNTGSIPWSPSPRTGQNMALFWPKHGPSNWFFLNLNHCAQGCSMPNYTLLDISYNPLSLELAKIWPFTAKTWSSHGPQNCFVLNLNQCAQGCPCQISHCWVYPVAPFPIDGQNMAFLGPKHGPHMVPQIAFSRRDGPCQIS